MSGGTRATRVVLVPVGAVDDDVLAALAADLAPRLGLPCPTAPRLPPDPAWAEPLTGRPRSGAVLEALAPRAEPDAWTLGVTEADLRGGGGVPVFGEAEPGTQCAVVGLARLREGKGSDDGVFGARLLAEAVHELGHLAGLPHCRHRKCVMFPSAHIAETDAKGSAFCRTCARGAGLPARKA
jgi:archaemetzincin